jgi:hypothetical protein
VKAGRVVLAVVTMVAATWLSPTTAESHNANTYVSSRWKPCQVSCEIPYYINVQDSYMAWTSAMRARVASAAAAWSKASPEPAYRYVADATFEPDSCNGPHANFLYWGRRDGRGNVLATTMSCVFGADHSRRLSFNIEIDSADYSTAYFGTRTPPSTRWDFWSVMTHELGHAMGFGHLPGRESICRNYSGQNTMCPTYYPGTTRVRSLASHDLHTFDGAYPTLP